MFRNILMLFSTYIRTRYMNTARRLEKVIWQKCEIAFIDHNSMGSVHFNTLLKTKHVSYFFIDQRSHILAGNRIQLSNRNSDSVVVFQANTREG